MVNGKDVDFRLVVAINVVLEERVKGGGFCEDLYFWLNVLWFYVLSFCE